MSDNGAVSPPARKGDKGAHPVTGMGNLGLNIFLGSITMVFAACILGYVAVWSRAPEWPPEGFPGFPRGLWWSTFLVLAISAVLFVATAAARAGKRGLLIGALAVALLLSLAFLGNQISNWASIVSAWEYGAVPDVERDPETGRYPIAPRLYAFVFYLLTGIHALHVLGGLVPLVFVLARAGRGAYGPGRDHGVRYCARYWHYLDAMWCVLFVILLLTF